MPTRLELSVADLMRVRVGAGLGPLAEAAIAYSGLQARASGVAVSGVVRRARERATASDRALASYLWLSPSVGFDLFTLGSPARGRAGRAASVLDTPDEVWRSETDAWARLRIEARRRGLLGPAAGQAADVEALLGDGDVDRWRALIGRLEDGFASWVGPHWPRIADRVDAESHRLAHRVATGGLEALAEALGERVRWDGRTLEVRDPGVTGTHSTVIELHGGGLTVVPSFFALRPMVYRPAEPSEPVLLIVPCASTELSPPERGPGAVPGAELLGRTRAAVLGRLALGPRTTSRLSEDLGIALSGASQHAAVLRRAGLVATVREGGHVQHSLTALGQDLLDRL